MYLLLGAETEHSWKVSRSWGCESLGELGRVRKVVWDSLGELGKFKMRACDIFFHLAWLLFGLSVVPLYSVSLLIYVWYSVFSIPSWTSTSDRVVHIIHVTNSLSSSPTLLFHPQPQPKSCLLTTHLTVISIFSTLEFSLCPSLPKI